MPANYENGFDSCKADDVEPMGEVSLPCSKIDCRATDTASLLLIFSSFLFVAQYQYKGSDGRYTT